MTTAADRTMRIPLGIVIRRVPGVTKWAKHVWKAVAVLPGAAEAEWKELRREGDSIEFHAATLPLELHRTETEAYLQALSDEPPAVYVVMRDSQTEHPLDMTLVTASPYEAQDYADTGEELVEKVPMPAGLIALIQEFVTKHHEDEVFIKRRRDKKRIDLDQDGVGDRRIKQDTDVYRAPTRREQIH